MLVNGFLVVIWAMTGAGFFWPVFPIVGWGIGVAAKALGHLQDAPTAGTSRPRPKSGETDRLRTRASPRRATLQRRVISGRGSAPISVRTPLRVGRDDGLCPLRYLPWGRARRDAPAGWVSIIRFARSVRSPQRLL